MKIYKLGDAYFSPDVTRGFGQNIVVPNVGLVTVMPLPQAIVISDTPQEEAPMPDYIFINDMGQLLDLSSQPSPEAARREAERLAAAYRARSVTIGRVETEIKARLCSCGYAYEIKPYSRATLYCSDCDQVAKTQ